MPGKRETIKERNRKFREMKHKYAFLDSCPICGKKYDKYWKIFSHIRKSKEDNHKSFLYEQISEASEIYNGFDGSVFDFFETLYLKRNILSAISNGYVLNLIKEHLGIGDFETIRRNRISKTMTGLEKSEEHNKNVSKALKKAWENGVFDTKKYKEAYWAGRKNMLSMKGRNNPMYGKPCPKGAGRGKGGFREDIHLYVRSTWEANFVRILQYLNLEFEYEKNRFNVNSDTTYSPDFYLKRKNLFYEIKGHARSRFEWKCNCKNCKKGKLAIKELQKRGIRIKLIGHREYKILKNKFKIKLEKWEG